VQVGPYWDDGHSPDLNFPPPHILGDLHRLKEVGSLAKHLFIGKSVPEHHIASLLEACINVQDLAICLDYIPVLPMEGISAARFSVICAKFKSLRKLKFITRITGTQLRTMGASFVGDTLTHLDILYPVLEEEYWTEAYGSGISGALSCFRELTHLSLNIGRTPIKTNGISEIINACLLLKVFIIKAIPDPIPKVIPDIWVSGLITEDLGPLMTFLPTEDSAGICPAGG